MFAGVQESCAPHKEGTQQRQGSWRAERWAGVDSAGAERVLGEAAVDSRSGAGVPPDLHRLLSGNQYLEPPEACCRAKKTQTKFSLREPCSQAHIFLSPVGAEVGALDRAHLSSLRRAVG